jgi:hypothetical protein
VSVVRLPRLAFVARAAPLLVVLGGGGGGWGSLARAQPPPAPAQPTAAPAAPATPGTTTTAAPAQRALGGLEQESVDDALARLGITVDPAPRGKTVGTIHVVNQEVFSPRDWRFQWFNIFHRTSREDVIRREVLLRPGAPYDQELVEESTRNFQSPPPLVLAGGTTFPPPELSSVIVILPVTSPVPGVVDLLVVTRDIWSLRFNTDFEFQQNSLVFLSTSLSENNLFGWRKFLSVGLLVDQGTIGFGPTYYDPNIHGTRLTLYAAATLWYARDTRDYEGNSERMSLHYPLFSLASRWGAGVDVTNQDTVFRSFRANNLQLIDVPDPAGRPDPTDMTKGLVFHVPYVYRQRRVVVDSNVVRSFQTGPVIQRVSLGHLFDRRRAEVPAGFAFDPATAQAFLKGVAPDPEQRSEPYLRYQLFTPRFAILRDLDTFDLRENRQLGPAVSLRLSYGLPALGADFRAWGLSGSASWAFDPGGGYLFFSALSGARIRDGRPIDQITSERIYAATPVLARAVRLVVSGEADATRADTLHSLYFLGGRTGLRGYAIGDFFGTSLLVGHVELRSLPLAVFSQRIGGLLFYDVGGARYSWRFIHPHHDLGLGLRWLIPQFNSSVLRVDWAFATPATALTRAGWPGRVTAGFQQVF